MVAFFILFIFSLFFFAPFYGIAIDDTQTKIEDIDPLEAIEFVNEIEEIEATDEFKAFRTAYTTIFYTHEEDLETFLWNITGDKEINIYSYPGIAKSRVDRIVEKVQSILDMYPPRFHIKVYVHPRYDERGPIAFYSHKTRSITTFADVATEGAFAHEVAHAVIRSYFKILPPKKIREMLSQYVDQHLWKE